MRTLCLIACLACVATLAVADGGVTYMRDRGPVARGFHGSLGYFPPPFYGNFFFQPPIYGSYYQRPYPTHLDYFRLRGMPMPDCPCADPIPAPPEVVPAE
jgi:hypothetical protein